MSESKKPKTGAQIERITEDDREKIVLHKSFYISIGLMVFVTIAACILFFFIIQRYEGFADAWNKVMKAAQPIIIGLVVAYLLNPIMKFWERTFFRFFGFFSGYYNNRGCFIPLLLFHNLHDRVTIYR